MFSQVSNLNEKTKKPRRERDRPRKNPGIRKHAFFLERKLLHLPFQQSGGLFNISWPLRGKKTSSVFCSSEKTRKPTPGGTGTFLAPFIGPRKNETSHATSSQILVLGKVEFARVRGRLQRPVARARVPGEASGLKAGVRGNGLGVIIVCLGI